MTLFEIILNGNITQMFTPSNFDGILIIRVDEYEFEKFMPYIKQIRIKHNGYLYRCFSADNEMDGNIALSLSYIRKTENTDEYKLYNL